MVKITKHKYKKSLKSSHKRTKLYHSRFNHQFLFFFSSSEIFRASKYQNLLFLLRTIIFWQDSELLVKTFGKIRHRIESYNENDFINSIFSLFQQFGRFLETDQPDKLIWGKFRYISQFTIQGSTAHIQHLSQ